jgi:hypothetical protein
MPPSRRLARSRTNTKQLESSMLFTGGELTEVVEGMFFYASPGVANIVAPDGFNRREREETEHWERLIFKTEPPTAGAVAQTSLSLLTKCRSGSTKFSTWRVDSARFSCQSAEILRLSQNLSHVSSLERRSVKTFASRIIVRGCPGEKQRQGKL